LEFAVRLVSVLALLAFSTAPALAQDDYKSLPAGQGRDVMVRVCAQCHSPEIAANQKLDAAGWKDLVNQMANNGAQATDAEFDTITKYLAASFPAK
jgi:mono/diheme cytochrome c family protein